MHPLDGYLLDGSPAKASAIEAALAAPADDPRAQPFYRALRTLGANVADEALLALRLVLAGREPDDAGVRTLRDARTAVRSGDAAARARYFAVLNGTN